MGFTNVVLVDKSEEETRNFGKRKEFAALENLYEVRTIATVGADNEDGENLKPEEGPPSVLATSNGQSLAIALRSDISLFSLNHEIVYKAGYNHANGVILSMCWLGESQFLAVFTSNNELVIISSELAGPVYAVNINVASGKSVQASMDAHINSANCQIVISLTGTSSYFSSIIIPDFEMLATCKADDIPAISEKIFPNVSTTIESTSCPIDKLILSNGSTDILGVLPSTSTFLHSSTDSIDFSSFFDLGEDKSIVALREACKGRYQLGLLSDATLFVYDTWSCAIRSNKKLPIANGHKLMDFLLINHSETVLSKNLIALVIQTEDGAKIEVRSLKTFDISYSLAVREQTSLVPISLDFERVMLLVEPFVSTKVDWREDKVRIREISESLPTKRLDRLITRNQFEEAEMFAKQFNLDVQAVYIAKMNFLLSEAVANGDNKVFDGLIMCMDEIKDHNLVGDTCYAGASIFTNYEHIVTILAYANKRGMTDADIVDRLGRLAYVLGSYRMLSGLENPNFSPDSDWPTFVSGVEGAGEWFDIFLKYLETGLVKEAHLLYQRHTKVIIDSLSIQQQDDQQVVHFPGVSQVFAAIMDALNKDLNVWKDVVEFLEFDFCPNCFVICPQEISSSLVSVLKHLVHFLEAYIPSEFPNNALYAASTYERILKKMEESEISFAKQAEFASICRNMLDSGLDDVIMCSQNLKAMKRLKDVYLCSLGYDTYMSLTPEKICHLILKKAIENPNFVGQNVAKYARPYMDEHHLDPDLTLFRYIEEVSHQSKGVVTVSNPWDEHCLLVCDTIEKFPLKCRAVTMIAFGAFPPWSKKLTAAVDSILANAATDSSQRAELQRARDMSELMLIVSSYGVQISLIDAIIASESSFTYFLKFIFQETDRVADSSQRLKDALKAFSIYKCVVMRRIRLTNCRIITLFAEYLATHGEYRDVIKFLNTIDEDKMGVSKKEVEEDFTNRLIDSVNYAVPFTDETIVKNRVEMMELTESILLQYNHNATGYYHDVYLKVVCLRKLQTKYNIWGDFQKIDNPTYRFLSLKNFICSKDASLSDIYAFSSALGMSSDEAARMAIQIAFDSNNLDVLLHIMKQSLIAKPSRELAEICVISCAKIVEKLPDVCSSSDDLGAIDLATDYVIDLRRILPEVIENLEHDVNLLRLAIKMASYLGIFAKAIEQCLIDESIDKKTDKTYAVDGRITGMSKRVGVYLLSNDGPLLEKLDAVTNLCAVGPSIVANLESMTNTVREEFVNTYINKWEELFTFFSLQNQDLLEVYSRVFVCYLDFGSVFHENISSNLRNSCRNLCERMLQQHPCDLWSVSTLISCLNLTDMTGLNHDLRLWTTTKKAPQTMINFLRVVQFFTVLAGSKDMVKTLCSSFTSNLWSKRLGKAGIFTNVIKVPIQTALVEFAKKHIDTDMVAEFVRQFCGEHTVAQQMLNYCLVLISQASTSAASECSVALQCADDALKSCSLDTKTIFHHLREHIYTICPYNYEVINFIVCRLVPRTGEDGHAISFTDGCQRIMQVLSDRTRTKPPCREELDWYLKHSKMFVKTKKESEMSSSRDKMSVSHGELMRVCYEESSGALDNSSICPGSDAIQYERGDVFSSNLPSTSAKRLPFHPFLFCMKEDLEKYLIPIIETEVSVINVSVWQSVRTVKWLRQAQCIPRPLFVSCAVVKKSKEYTDRNENLSSDDVTAIRSLLMNTERPSVISCIASCFRKVPLSLTKVTLLELGVEVANHWLNTESLEPPLSPDETKEYTDHVLRLSETIDKYKTELILRSAGLYDSTTSDLVENPSELIIHIYSNTIDWTDENDIKKKTNIINELANINYRVVTLLNLQTDLILRWLPESATASVDIAVDLNDTMGAAAVPLSTPNSSADEGEIYHLPVFHTSITRIVKLIEMVRSVNVEESHRIMSTMLSTYFKKKDVTMIPGTYKTVVRCALVLLRSFTDEELSMSKFSHMKLCVAIERCLNGRLLELSREDISNEAFQNHDKLLLVKSYLAPSKRQSPQLCVLAACIVIDFQIADRTILDTLLSKLYSARKREMFLALLKFCKTDPHLRRVKNLPLHWARACDQLLNSTDENQEQFNEIMRNNIMFCLSCPVEGGRSFDSIQSTLKSRGCTIASQMMAVAGNYTKRLPSLHVNNTCEADLRLRWCDDVQSIMTSQSEDAMSM